MNVWRRFGAWAALPALALCVLLVVTHRPVANAVGIVLAFCVLIEGAALLTNWHGMASSTAEQTGRAFGDVLRFRQWEVRIVVGGSYVFMGVLLFGLGIHNL